MSDVIQVEAGFSPWQPAHDARLVKEYWHYDIPLAGVIEQHDVHYAFYCAGGADERVSYWLYARITAVEEALLDLASAEEFMHFSMEGQAVLALAIEGKGVIASEAIDEMGADTVRNAHEALVEQLREWIEAAEHTPVAAFG